MEQVLPLVEPLMREHGVSVVTDEIDVVPMADPTRLRQVLLNLLTNAVKYNRSGGSVTIAAEASDGVVLIRVVDSGRGMTPEQQRHLFEPFNRLGAEGDRRRGHGHRPGDREGARRTHGRHGRGDVERGHRQRVRAAPARRRARAAGTGRKLASPQALALAATAGRVARGRHRALHRGQPGERDDRRASCWPAAAT